MPQPKSPRSAGKAATKTAAAKRTAKPAKAASAAKATKAPAQKKAAPPKKAAAPKRAKPTARKASFASAGVSGRSKKTGPSASARGSASSSVQDPLAGALAAIGDRLVRGLTQTGERLGETIDDAVKSGRLNGKDAEELIQRLISAGLKQTEDVLGELEQIVQRASRKVRKKLP